MTTIILKRKYFGEKDPEKERSYIPYEESKRRKRETNLLTAGGIGASLLGAGGYYGLKASKINKKARKDLNDTYISELNKAYINRDNAYKETKRIIGNYIDDAYNIRGVRKGKKARKLLENLEETLGKEGKRHEWGLNNIANTTSDNMKSIEDIRKLKLGRAAKKATALAAAGTGLVLGARALKRKRDKKKKYYDS